MHYLAVEWTRNKGGQIELQTFSMMILVPEI